MDIIKDVNGKISSKRLLGIVLITIGVIMHIITYIKTTFFLQIIDANTSIAVANNLIYVGGVLVGIGVFENLGNGK